MGSHLLKLTCFEKGDVHYQSITRRAIVSLILNPLSVNRRSVSKIFQSGLSISAIVVAKYELLLSLLLVKTE